MKRLSLLLLFPLFLMSGCKKEPQEQLYVVREETREAREIEDQKEIEYLEEIADFSIEEVTHDDVYAWYSRFARVYPEQVGDDNKSVIVYQYTNIDLTPAAAICFSEDGNTIYQATSINENRSGEIIFEVDSGEGYYEMCFNSLKDVSYGVTNTSAYSKLQYDYIFNMPEEDKIPRGYEE